ncbi:CotH kinase family protein [Paraflavisolibacter sp. H34]|uniref:CotH kinase family protein n=1 Tax=Huijunlia imazamoxiresistens TaxID=3127457 RepID=UPI003017E739
MKSATTIGSFLETTTFLFLLLLLLSSFGPRDTVIAPRAGSGGVVLSLPAFSVAPGVYTTAQTVALTHPDGEVAIRYTLDGSIPTDTSPLYHQPLHIGDRSGQPNDLSLIPTNRIISGSRAWEPPEGLVRKGTVVRARAFKGPTGVSGTLTGTFLVLPGRPYTLPVVSVVAPRDSLFGTERGIYVPGNTDDTTGEIGNYNQEGEDWERPASVEFFGPDIAFQQDVGLRINGDYSRRFPQKSLRVLARAPYGKATLDYAVFPRYSQKSFKRLILRNSGNDWGRTFFKDALAHMLVRSILPIQHYRPTVVFLNGEYWGLHNLRERPDKFFLASVYGVDPDDLDLLSGNLEVSEGDADHYDELLRYLQKTDLSTVAGFEGVARRMDVENYLDYYSAEIYFANTDWPQSNIDYWRERVPYNPAALPGRDGRWRWILHDVDLGLEDPQFDAIAWTTAPESPYKSEEWPNVLLRALLANPSFKQAFINRIADQLNSVFVPGRVHALVDSVKALVEPEIPEHDSRWGKPSPRRWAEEVEVLKDFARLRPSFLRQHLMTHFQLADTLRLTLQVSGPEQGGIRLNSLEINGHTPGADSLQPYPWRGVYFSGLPLSLKALARPGYVFDHWQTDSGEVRDPELRLTPSAATTVTACFRGAAGVQPRLAAPANGATAVALHPAVLSWHALAGASAYRLQVALRADFATTVLDQGGITDRTKGVSGLRTHTTYFWRVQALTGNGPSDWSEAWRFTTEPPPPAVLVGHWKMDEGQGAVLTDHSGNGHHARLQDPRDVRWTAGREGLALVLPGSEGRVAIAPDHPGLRITDALSIAAWIRPLDVSTRTILSKSGPDGYSFALNDDGRLEFRFNHDTHGNAYRLVSRMPYPFDSCTWMHVAATFDGTTSRIYVNGVLDTAITYAGPVAILENRSGLQIGSLLGLRRWKGALDEVRLYHGALSAAEVAGLASAPRSISRRGAGEAGRAAGR